MKKVLFYGTLIGIWVLCWLVLATIFALAFGPNAHLDYSIGRWCATPFVILIAIGVTLLFRCPISGIVYGTVRKFSISAPIVFLAIGILWGSVNIITSAISQRALNNILDIYNSRTETRYEQSDDMVLVTMDDAGVSTFHIDSCCRAIHKEELYHTTDRETALESGFTECSICGLSNKTN